MKRVGEKSLAPGLERTNASPAAEACFISHGKMMRDER